MGGATDLGRSVVKCRGVWPRDICYRRVSLNAVPSAAQPSLAVCCVISPEWLRPRSAGHDYAAYVTALFPANKTAFAPAPATPVPSVATSAGILHPEPG